MPQDPPVNPLSLPYQYFISYFTMSDGSIGVGSSRLSRYTPLDLAGIRAYEKDMGVKFGVDVIVHSWKQVGPEFFTSTKEV